MLFPELKQLKIGDQIIIEDQHNKCTDPCTLISMTKPRSPTEKSYLTWSAWGRDNYQEFTFCHNAASGIQRFFGNDKITLATDTYGWVWRITNINGEWV